jgi:hypothetical protein
MSMRSEISTRPLSGSSERTAETAWSLISQLTGNPDLIAVAVFFVIGLVISLWLTIQFPVTESTAIFLARFG